MARARTPTTRQTHNREARKRSAQAVEATAEEEQEAPPQKKTRRASLRLAQAPTSRRHSPAVATTAASFTAEQQAIIRINCKVLPRKDDAEEERRLNREQQQRLEEVEDAVHQVAASRKVEAKLRRTWTRRLFSNKLETGLLVSLCGLVVHIEADVYKMGENVASTTLYRQGGDVDNEPTSWVVEHKTIDALEQHLRDILPEQARSRAAANKRSAPQAALRSANAQLQEALQTVESLQAQLSAAKAAKYRAAPAASPNLFDDLYMSHEASSIVSVRSP